MPVGLLILKKEREELKKEVIANGNKVSEKIMNEALEMMKLGDIPFTNRKATIDVEQKKGYISEDGEFKNGGLTFKLDYEKELETGGESGKMDPVFFENGLGDLLIKSCFRNSDGLGDPCKEIIDYDVACIHMLEGAAYIGVGYDGRGDYTCNDRKKSLIRRKCGSRNFYQGEQVPDAMNVWGVYDSEC